MKGKILDFSLQNGGIISAEDGKRYKFVPAEWKEQGMPARNMSVDFNIDASGSAVSIYRVSGSVGSVVAGSGGKSPVSSDTDDNLFNLAIYALTKNYVNFNGCARRKEYWGLQLILFIPYMIMSVLAGSRDEGVVFLSLIGMAAIAIPSVAAASRRLHDTDRSGWWQLITLVPLVGLIVMIIFCAQEGTQGENRYGEDPKA